MYIVACWCSMKCTEKIYLRNNLKNHCFNFLGKKHYKFCSWKLKTFLCLHLLGFWETRYQTHFSFHCYYCCYFWCVYFFHLTRSFSTFQSNIIIPKVEDRIIFCCFFVDGKMIKESKLNFVSISVIYIMFFYYSLKFCHVLWTFLLLSVLWHKEFSDSLEK